MSDIFQNKPTTLYKLVWKDDRSLLKEYVLNRAITTYIGRDAGNHIILLSPRVSKRHAEVLWSEKNFLIVDQGSSNGTSVNGKSINAPTQLKNGDRIEIGDFVLSFFISEEETKAELKTRPLEELETIEGQPISELLTQILPGTKEKTQEMGVTPEEKTMVDDPKPSSTVIQEQPGASTSPTRDMPKEAEPVLEIPSQEKITDHVEETFADLLASIFSAQSSWNILKNKGLNIKVALDASLEQLHLLSGEMKSLEEEAVKTGLGEVLARLSSNPNDITLLMELSQHTELLGRIVRNYSVQAAVIEKIKAKLESELKPYVS